MKRTFFCTLTTLAALLCLVPAQAQTYKLTDTGHVGDNLTASGVSYSISENGIVGGQSTPSTNRGFLWQNGVVTPLDDVQDASGFTYVHGVNSAGVAVGSCADYFSPHDRFVRWQNGAATDLGSIGDGQGDAQAFAINDSGLIVGTSYDAFYGREHAVTYDTAFHLLPYLTGAPANAYAEAHAVNASGEAAGYCYGADGQYHATLWKGGKAYDLGTFGGRFSQAEGMNDAGQVVGWYETAPDADGNTHLRAFLWTPTTTNGTSGTMQDIGVLPGGNSAQARDINNNGQIVGYSFSASASGYAFLWDAAHGMRDLTKLVTSISTEVQPNNNNYYLTDAAAINDNGQIAADFTIFISDGSTDHVEHGCILTPNGGTTAAKAKSLSFTPNPVVGGQTATGTITLTAAAPAGGAVVTITENGGTLGTITVPAGSTSTTFTLTTSTVTTSETDTFGAVYGGATATTTLTITPATAGTPVINSVAPTAATAGGPAFTLTVNGANFVSGSIVKWNGATETTTFVSSTKLTATIPASLITTAGTASITVTTPHVGTSAAKTFTINAATTGTPTITSLSPGSVIAGGAAFTLTVNGTNFVSGSIVKWNGATETTTFVSATKLTASIPASLITTAGTAAVTVTTPHVGTSAAATFTINAATTGVPTITSLSPSSAAAGGPAFTLTVNGTNFVSGSIVKWNGATETTTLVSGTKLTASIPASLITTAGTASITVTTPHVGTSAAKTFTVTATSAVTAKSLTAAPSTVFSNGQTSCVITLSGAAPTGGASVPISANGTVFYTATVPAGQTSTTFFVTWGVATTTTTNTLSAAYGGKTVTTTVTVQPTTVTLSKYTFSPNPIVGGQTATANIELSAVAPAGGAVVTITYNGTYFYQVMVPAGSSKVSYSQATSTVTSNTSYTFTATYNGSSLSKTLNVTP